MDNHLERITLVIFLIVSLWSTYMFGYNRGFDSARVHEDVETNKTLNALQMANQYQDMFLQCYEGRPMRKILNQNDK